VVLAAGSAVDSAAAVVDSAEEGRLDAGKQNVPNWARGMLNAVDVERIQAAIFRAESSTSGEIVPMIVRRSAAVGHVPFLLFFLVTIVFAASGLTDLAFQRFDIPFLSMGLTTAFAAVIAVFASRAAFIQRWFTVSFDRDQQVRMRAELEFYEAGLNHTSGGTGILIFVSLMEHQVVVLADQGISSRLPADTWSNLVHQLVASIKAKRFGEGLSTAVEECGKILQEKFPRAANDRNELKDHILFKE
jgi:putative membrane protein